MANPNRNPFQSPLVSALTRSAMKIVTKPVVPGNIDLAHRPIVHNPDGSISTVRSITITDDHGNAILIPTVVGDKVVSDRQAIAHYNQTGQHLGKFASEAAANGYAQTLHESQAKKYLPVAKGAPYKPVESPPAAPAPGRRLQSSPASTAPALGSLPAWTKGSGKAPASTPVAVKTMRRNLYRKTVDDVNSGKITEKQAGATLKAAGFPDSHNRFVPQANGPQTLVSKTLTGLAHMAVGLPGGLIKTGVGVGHDFAAADRKAFQAMGVHTTPGRADFSFKNTRATGAAVKDSYAATIEHPLRNPAESLVNIAGALSLGAGTVARVGAVTRAATVAKTAAKTPDLASAYRALPAADRRAYDALARVGSDVAGMPELDVHTATRIAHPSPQLGALLNHDTTLAAARRDIVKGLGDGSVKPVPLSRLGSVGASVLDVRASRGGQMMRAAVTTPLPTQRTIVVPGEGGAALKSGQEGPTHPHTAVEVHPLGSKNALVNALQRVGDKKTQRQLDAGARVGVPSRAGQKALELAARASSPQAKVGRELRADREVIDTLQLAPVSRLERFGKTVPAAALAKATGGRIDRARVLPGKLKGSKLSAAEQKAIEIVGSGRTATEHMASSAFYREQARSGEKGYGTVRDHNIQIALAKAAEEHLRNPSPALKAALAETRGAITGREHLLGMTPDEIAHRVGGRSLEIKHGARGQKSPLQRAEEIDGRLAAQSPTLARAITRRDQLQAGLDRLTGKGKKGGYSAVERPLTVDEAHARLHDLETEHNRALDEMGSAMFGPIDRSEVARRNVNNARVRRQNSGWTRGATPADISRAEAKLQAAEAHIRAGRATGADMNGHSYAVAHQEAAEARAVLAGPKARRSGAAGRMYEAKPTVKAERRREVEKAIGEAMDRNADHPSMQRWKERAEEIDRLKAALAPMPGDGVDMQALGKRREYRSAQPSHQRVSGALSVANDEVQRLSRFVPDDAERAALEAERAAIHSAITAEGHRVIGQGGFYVPARKMTDTYAPMTPATRSPGPTGYSPPQTLKELQHAYTGALHRSGNYRTDTTGVVAQSYRGAQRLATLQRGFDVMLRMSRPTIDEAGGHNFAIPIRESREIPRNLRELIQAADRGELTAADFKSLGQKDAEALIEHFFPDPSTVDRATSTIRGTNDKVRWVDSRMAGGLHRQAPGTIRAQGREFDVGLALDAVNAPFRAGALYFAPKYALNLVQQVGTHVIEAGVFAPGNLKAALQLGKTVGTEAQHQIFALVGEGKSRSFAADSGPLAGTIDSAATFWNAITDRIPRAASWLHEARREGFATAEQIKALLNDPRLRDKLVEVTRRANNEAVPYGHLTPLERQLFKRALFFYGWTRAATEWSLRFPFEHPAQAMLYAPLGQQGYEWERKELGRVRPFLAGLVPLTGGDHPLVSDMTNLNNFSTPVGVGRAVGGLVHPSRNEAAGELAGQLGPVVGAAGTLVFGRTGVGYQVPASQSRVSASLQELEGVLPPFTFKRRLKHTPPGTKPLRRPSFEPGLGTAIGGYLGGAVAPRRLDKESENAKAERDYRAALPAAERALYDDQHETAQENADAHALHAQGTLPTDKLPPQVVKAQELHTARKLAYIAAADRLHVRPDELSVKQKALADLRVAVQEKTVSPATARNAGRVFGRASGAELARARNAFWRTYGLGEVLTYWDGYVKAHHAA